MCYLDLLADTNRNHSSPSQLFCFPSPKDCLQHLQNHSSLNEWQLDLSRGSLQRDRAALWGAVQPREALLLLRVFHAVDTAKAQRGAISLLFSRDPWRNERKIKFCLSYNKIA